MTGEEIAYEIIPTNILTQDEILEILLNISSNGKTPTKFNSKPRCKVLKIFKSLPKSTISGEVISNRICLSPGEYFYSELKITEKGILTCTKWDGTSGGRLLLSVRNLIIEKGGMIDLTGVGYRGGKCSIKHTYPDSSFQGESFSDQGCLSLSPNQGGGGGGITSSQYGSIGGGGGGYGTNGDNSKPNTYSGNRSGGQGGLVYGSGDMNEIYMGSGGGGGTLYSYYNGDPSGGAGGGILVIEVHNFSCDGKILVNGENGSNGTDTYSSGGGGGSGGSIFIFCSGNFSNKGEIRAEGGKGGQCNVASYPGIASEGGNGGNGRIRICAPSSDFGVISPDPYTESSSLPSKIL